MPRSINQHRRKELIVDTLFDIVGCFIFSVGVQALCVPFDLPSGGVTGIAVIINHLTGWSVSAMSFIINLPLLIMAALKLGRKFTLNSIKTVIILSISLEICARVIPRYEGDIMLASLFGGVIQGVGLGLVFMRGSTTGGTDILCRLIQQKRPHLSMGRLMLIVDAAVLILTAIVYKSLANAMYSLIIVFVSSQVIDGIVYGLESGRMLMVISEEYKAIYKAIDEEIGRGGTLLHGTGTYTGTDRPVLICAISTPEFHRVKKLVYQIDPSAFVVSLETDEVLGEGFKSLEN